MPWRARRAAVSSTARLTLGFARLESTGSRDEGDAAWEPLGFLEGWRVIGPFDNERGGGFRTEYGPEKEIRLDASYDGKKRPVRWRGLPARPLAGLVNLAILQDPREEVLVADGELEADEAAEVIAGEAGIDDGDEVGGFLGLACEGSEREKEQADQTTK